MNAVFTVILGISTILITIKEPSLLLPAFLNGASDAIKFTLVLFGSYALWLGVFKITEQAGINEFFGKLLKPLTRKLFPGEDKQTLDSLTLNLTANMLGTGGAATPMGIKAISEMKSKKNATMLVVLNSTSLQIIPTTILAMRAEAQATMDILLPSVLTTLLTTLLAVTAVKLFEK